jgi:hypothetical protein
MSSVTTAAATTLVGQIHAEFKRLGFSRHRHSFGMMSMHLIGSAELLVAFMTDGDPSAATDDQIDRAASFVVSWQFEDVEKLVPLLIAVLKERRA